MLRWKEQTFAESIENTKDNIYNLNTYIDILELNSSKTIDNILELNFLSCFGPRSNWTIIQNHLEPNNNNNRITKPNC